MIRAPWWNALKRSSLPGRNGTERWRKRKSFLLKKKQKKRSFVNDRRATGNKLSQWSPPPPTVFAPSYLTSDSLRRVEKKRNRRRRTKRREKIKKRKERDKCARSCTLRTLQGVRSTHLERTWTLLVTEKAGALRARAHRFFFLRSFSWRSCFVLFLFFVFFLIFGLSFPFETFLERPGRWSLFLFFFFVLPLYGRAVSLGFLAFGVFTCSFDVMVFFI